MGTQAQRRGGHAGPTWWRRAVAAGLVVALLGVGCSSHKGYRWVHERTEREETILGEETIATARLEQRHWAVLSLKRRQDYEVQLTEIWKQMDVRKKLTGLWIGLGSGVGLLTLFILLLIAASNSGGSGSSSHHHWDWDD